MLVLQTAGETWRSVGGLQANEKQQLKTRNQVQLVHERYLKEVLVRGRGGHFTVAVV